MLADTVLKLSAGAVDIASAGVAHVGFDPVAVERANPVVDYRWARRMKGAALDFVHGKQIHMNEEAVAKIEQGFEVVFAIVDIAHHEVLDAWSSRADAVVGIERLLQIGKGRSHTFGHDSVACGLDGGMQRERERELFGFVGEGVDSLDDAARRNGDMPGPDAQGEVAVHDAQGLHDVVVVEKGLALAHGHHVAYAGTEISLHGKHLLDHFAGQKVARESFLPRSTEGTGHGTADLRGKTDGQTAGRAIACGIPRGDPHRFHAGAIG